MIASTTARPNATAKTIARFWRKVDRSGACWLWTGAVASGYGRLWCAPQYWLAHRFSYALAHGAIPDNLCVLHTCDRPLCVRPDHLVLGTQIENIRDRCDKGRTRGSRVPTKGSAQPRALLSEERVGALRKKHAEGVPPSQLLAESGVALPTLKKALYRQTWRHVP